MAVTPAASVPSLSPARRGRWLLGCAVVATVVVLAVLPWLIPGRADLLNLLLLVFLYVTLGQSWNILGGFAGQVNLGHAAFFGLGAMAARGLWLGGWPAPLALGAGGLAALVFALVIGVPTFRLHGAYFAIGTLGMAEALRVSTGNLLSSATSLPPDLVNGYDLGIRYQLALAIALACVLAAWLLLRSRVGLGILAVREDEEAAAAVGVGALRHKLVALSISSLFAGLAGAVFAFYHVSYYPAFAFSPTWTFDALLPVYLGGVGTLVGPIVGAVLYVLVREQLALTLPQAHVIIFGILFIVVVLAFPGGLVDVWTRVQRVYAGRR